MTQSTKPIGILGGTFDPVHYGHLRLALELYQQLDLQEVRFIPCQKPVLDKTAQANPDQRLTMLKLAIADQLGLSIDTRELNRQTPSYMVETLISLRQELGDVPLALIMGVDAFYSLSRWHRWQELTRLAHFIVVARPGTADQVTTPDFINATQIIQEATLLTTAPAGYIIFPEIPLLEISSTFIRQQINSGFSPRYLLPDAVLRFIQQENLYE